MNDRAKSPAQAAMIWCPFGDTDSAREIAVTLVTERLVACVNIIPAITSVFRWEGEVEQAIETGALFKTTTKLLPAATERLATLHPYDTPAIVGWHVDHAAPATLEWLVRQTFAQES